MDSDLPTPLHIIQDSRYAKQDGWLLDNISLCSSGNIAVSGHSWYRNQSYVCIYGSTVDNSSSRDKPTLVYHKQLTEKLSSQRRCISFIKPNSTKIVTCRYDKVQVIDYKRDVVLRSRKVNGDTRCLSVSESQIFIGLQWSDIVNIYDNDLNSIKSIKLKTIRDDWLEDVEAAADRLYVCTAMDDRAIAYSQDSGNILTEYTVNVTGYGTATSITLNIQHQIVVVLWNRKQVAVYPLNSNNCLAVFNVESGVSRIRLSDQGRIVTGNEDTREVKIHDLMNWNIKLKNEKEYEREEVLNLSDVSMLEEPSTSYVGEKFVQEENSKQGAAQALIEEETDESNSEEKFCTGSPSGVPEQSQDTGSAEDKEETQEPTTSSLPTASTESSEYSHNQSTLKRTESILNIGVAVPEKKSKVVLEEPAVSGIEFKDDSEQIPVRNDEKRNVQEGAVASSYTSTKTIITKVGGTLEIYNTGILLVIPPDALPADKEEHEIHMRYISRRAVEDEVKCFSSNSTAVVEILPNLSLQHPVRLSLPHCLVLQQNLERKAKIFASHHEKGNHPFWEEQKDVSYHVEDTTCIMLLNSFSWYKYCIDDKIVIAKKIVVYTAAQKPKAHDGIIRIEVGCYPDLPGQEEDIPGGKNLIVAHKKILYFLKSEKQHPLQISLKDIFPSGWQCRSKFTDTLSKKIPYIKISEDLGNSCVYILEKPSNASKMPVCVFTASQEKDVEMDNIAVQLAINFQVIDKLPGITEGHQCNSSLKTEKNITTSGVELEIPGTGVVLKIPPNALEGNSENQFVGMRIIPSRIIEDQVTSISSNSCTAVEMYPHTVRLRHPVELRLPHCLTFNENSTLSARIFTNYKKGNLAKWEIDTQSEHKLDKKACVIKLNGICGVKYSIDDNIVKGKKIRVYTASKKLEQKDEAAELEVGFYSDIPGGGELLRMNPNFAVDSDQKCLYMRKEKSQLQLSLDDIAPSSLWECWFPKDKPQDIPIRAIAASIEHSSLFILKKTKNEVGVAVCTFTTLPKKGPMSLEMALSVCPQDEKPKDTDQSEEQGKKAVSMDVIIKQDQTKGTHQAEQEVAKGDQVTAVTIMRLSKKLGNSWKFVGRNLGLNDTVLNDIEKTHEGTREHSYQMLSKWVKNNGRDATHVQLIKTLIEEERQDLADDVKNWKDQQNA